jgi:hypothetical protein
MNFRKIGYWLIGVIVAFIAIRLLYRSILGLLVLGAVLYGIYVLFIKRDKKDRWF